MPTATAHTVWELATLADCYSPDSAVSAGAKFLESVQDAANDVGDPTDEDAAHEIADNAPDVYTHTRWLEFVDLGAYNEDATELGATADDMTTAAGVCLYMIAERLARILLEERAAAASDEDEDA